ncbi:hypothetical protein EJ02DRAFT_57214 [Clathrospora elynae]|uniref:Uncharacterized protein n=1 Tax=Clathrospora elynae TaxID=706981 RepID=A0A6A5SFS7_9PLEO|nr:hypothetical protein EJ02DRAFT_57214 [Clathrospora elynae]
MNKVELLPSYGGKCKNTNFQPNLPPCLDTPTIKISSASISIYLQASYPQFSEPPGFWLRCAAWCKLPVLLDGFFKSQAQATWSLSYLSSSEHQNFRPRPTPTPTKPLKLNQNQQFLQPFCSIFCCSVFYLSPEVY